MDKTKKLRKATFSLDCLHGKLYIGYTDGSQWNGFSCPLFTYQQTVTILNNLMALGNPETLQSWQYVGEFDSFKIYQTVYPDEPEVVDGIVIEDMKLYGLGAYSWTWDGVSE